MSLCLLSCRFRAAAGAGDAVALGWPAAYCYVEQRLALSAIVRNGVKQQRTVCRCGLGGWRNGLRFDPFKKYGDWSYVDIMLDPLVNALRTAMTKQTAVSRVA